ncbi:MAG: response regulator [Panacagrimonas sp.]
MESFRTPETPRLALIVEDFADAARWLRDSVLEAFPGIAVTWVATLAEGRRCLQGCRPDFALIDLGLPDGSGLELIAYCRSMQPPVPVVVTTILDDDAHILPAMRAGACGYLFKDESRETLALQLRAIVSASRADYDLASNPIR